MQSVAHATEAVVCSNSEIGIFVYYNLGDRTYGGIALFIDNEMIESDWKTKKADTNFRSMTILLQLQTSKKNASINTLQLNVNKEKGELRYGSKIYGLTCDWRAFSKGELQ